MSTLPLIEKKRIDAAIFIQTDTTLRGQVLLVSFIKKRGRDTTGLAQEGIRGITISVNDDTSPAGSSSTFQEITVVFRKYLNLAYGGKEVVKN